MKGVIKEIKDERKRQEKIEEFDYYHDEQWEHFELAAAASCYAGHASISSEARKENVGNTPDNWPWGPQWWKPSNRRRDLVKAAALIVAEIERIDAQEVPG